MGILKALAAELGPASLFWKIVTAIVIFFVGKKLITYLASRIDRITERAGLDVGIRKFMHSCVQMASYALLIFTIADLAGVPTASIVALVGSIGVTIGLALQNSLSNFASGVVLLFMHPFGVGDSISCSGIEGKVDAVGFLYTSVITFDNKRITVPNSVLANATVTNATAMDTRRIDLSIGIGYEDDVEKARKVLCDMINSREKIIRKSDTLIFIDKFDSSSVNLGIRCWVNTPDYWDERYAINREIKRVLDENGISIPYTKVDVKVVSEK